jgi:hypothetical protein
MTFIEDIANHLADMSGLTLPIYLFSFPSSPLACVCLFPSGAGVGGNIGVKPGYYAHEASAHDVAALEYPGIQIQVRHTSPQSAYRICEDVRRWLADNPPAGYLSFDTTDSQPLDFTNNADLEAKPQAVYRYAVNFGGRKVRV